MRWSRPSLAGRRLALERKYELNVSAYGGGVKLVTLTPAGEDLLPFGDETRLIHGEPYRLVEWVYREVWNQTAQARASRLFEAAQKAADRWVRKCGWSGELPRQIGNVKAEQKRGVWHFHYLLPMGSEIERVWSRTVHRYLDNAWKRDQARWPDESIRRDMIWNEYAHGEVVRGFYGFGYVNGGSQKGRTARTAARYAGRNAAGYMAGNVAGIGRHYVSSRLTRETGVTMRALRAVNWLYVRRKLVQEGELLDVIPGHWSPDWIAHVASVEALIARRGPPSESVEAVGA